MADKRFTALPTAEEFALLREAYAETYPVRPLLNAIDAKDAEIEQLRSVALAARALVQSAHACLASDDIEHDETSVSEPALTALESALEAAGYGMSEEEFERGVADETTPPRRLEDHENYCNEHGGHLRDSPACYLARERAR